MLKQTDPEKTLLCLVENGLDVTQVERGTSGISVHFDGPIRPRQVAALLWSGEVYTPLEPGCVLLPHRKYNDDVDICGCGTRWEAAVSDSGVKCEECCMSAPSVAAWKAGAELTSNAELRAKFHHAAQPRLWTADPTILHVASVAARCYVAATAGLPITFEEIATAWLHECSDETVLAHFPAEVVALVRAMQPTLPASSRADRHAASLAHFTSHPEVARVKCFDMRNNLVSVRAALRAKHVSRSYATRFAAECVEMARAISTEPFCVDGVLLAAERVC